jgi:nucleoside-diphosphate-sugar epimerase
LYAETKIAAEQIIANRDGHYQIFRLGTLFGLSDTYSRLRADLVLNTLTIRAVLENQMTVFGGRQYRPLLHVRDVATAMVPVIGLAGRNLYNLHAENLTIMDLAKRIQSRIPESEIIETDSKFQDSRNYQVSSALITESTGFAPRYTIDDGITEVADAVRKGRIKNVHSPRFSNVAAMTPVIGRSR